MGGSRRRSLASAVLAALALCAATPVRAQPGDVVNSQVFSFDFSAPPAEAKELQEVQLHFSADQGRTWKLYRGVPPTDGKIAFEASGDGEYWFAIQQVYRDGRRVPPRMEGVKPQRKVVVDTAPPRVELRPSSGGGKVGVEWTIQGDDADLATLRVDSRPTGRREWSPVSVSPALSGRKTWEPDFKGDHEVRLRVADRAGNEASRNVFVSTSRPTGGGEDSGPWSEPPRPAGIDDDGPRRGPVSSKGRSSGRLVSDGDTPAAPLKGSGSSSSAAVPTFYVNTHKFHVSYKIDGVGKSGYKAVHLFWRHPDVDEWTDYGPNPDEKPPFRVQVDGEGKYGIRLRAVSGVGLAEEPPRPGSPPQLWVVVDTTPPSVQLATPKVRFGTPVEVSFSWRAADDYPGENKVRLCYAPVDSPEPRPWKEIAKGLPNEGKHAWKPPADAPYKFVVRVEVEDAAGNHAHEETPEPVSIDDSRPRAVAIKVEAAGDPEPPTKPTASPIRDEPLTGGPPAKRLPTPETDDLSPAIPPGKNAGPAGLGTRPKSLPSGPSFP